MKNKSTAPTSSKKDNARLGEVIKLGVDVHIEKRVVVMKIDSSSPERPRRFTPEQFLAWVAQLAARCDKLYCCYEAGPFGYSLRRRLESISVSNYFIRPINWDEHGRKVKTDARDATQMALALDGYLRGNDRIPPRRESFACPAKRRSACAASPGRGRACARSASASPPRPAATSCITAGGSRAGGAKGVKP